MVKGHILWFNGHAFYSQAPPLPAFHTSQHKTKMQLSFHRFWAVQPTHSLDRCNKRVERNQNYLEKHTAPRRPKCQACLIIIPTWCSAVGPKNMIRPGPLKGVGGTLVRATPTLPQRTHGICHGDPRSWLPNCDAFRRIRIPLDLAFYAELQ
jgi:hypothetical protein